MIVLGVQTVLAQVQTQIDVNQELFLMDPVSTITRHVSRVIDNLLNRNIFCNLKPVKDKFLIYFESRNFIYISRLLRLMERFCIQKGTYHDDIK